MNVFGGTTIEGVRSVVRACCTTSRCYPGNVGDTQGFVSTGVTIESLRHKLKLIDEP